jgi:hypothetical protein
MAIYRVRTTAVRGLWSTHGHPRLAVAVVVAFVIVVAAPLAVDSAQIASQQLTNGDVTTVANNWANKVGWQVVNVSTTESRVTVRAIGPLPLPDPQTLRTALNANGLRAHRYNSSSTRSSASTSPTAERQRQTPYSD